MEIEIPSSLTGPLFLFAAESELSVEEIVEMAIKNYMKRSEDDAGH